MRSKTAKFLLFAIKAETFLYYNLSLDVRQNLCKTIVFELQKCETAELCLYKPSVHPEKTSCMVIYLTNTA